ncbi:MAG: hypothetical protein HC902_07880 [Calothrix sp. SM1_5_4]|nr:hypothetical protein [Calothrix sp. SM1_5_4]
MRLLAILALAPVIAFARPKINPDLVVSWEQIRELPPFEAPYWAEFQRDDVQLRYIAAHHDNDLNSTTMVTIRDVMETFGPDILLFEGLQWDKGLNPKSYAKYALSSRHGDFIGGGEPAYAVSLMISEGVPFRGGEPSETDILSEIQKRGYSTHDLVGFYAVRQYPEFIRNKQIDIKNPGPTFSKFIRSVCIDFKLPPKCFSFQKLDIPTFLWNA